jgi:hypothetical protein
MNDLGPLFGTKAIVGPILVIHVDFDGTHIALVGENHEVKGDTTRLEDTAVEQLAKYSNRKTCQVLCYCECTETYATHGYMKMRGRMEVENRRAVDVAQSPLWAYIAYSRTLKGIKNCFADVRNMPPYDLYKLITDPEIFKLEHFGLFTDTKTDKKVRRWAKLAEKSVIENIPNRTQAKSFMESLCLPDRQYPRWFVVLYKTINETDQQPPALLRDMMMELRRLDGNSYALVIEFISYLHGKWAIDPYTRAMSRVAAMRQTHASKLVAQIQSKADQLFIELSCFLLDVFVVLDILLKKLKGALGEGHDVVLFAGAKHAENVAMFFAKWMRCKVGYKFAADGNIAAGPAVPKTVRLGDRVHSHMVALKDANR